MEQINIQIPKGHEIDLEKSNLAEGRIVFKEKIGTSWKDGHHAINGFYIDDEASIVSLKAKEAFYSDCEEDKNIFAAEKQAKSALAMAQLSQIIANDKRFGGPITDKEWEDKTVCKRLILRQGNRITTDYGYLNYYFLAFHTVSQRDLFLGENEDLIKQYYMLD